jgi:hypothetical protein
MGASPVPDWRLKSNIATKATMLADVRSRGAMLQNPFKSARLSSFDLFVMARWRKCALYLSGLRLSVGLPPGPRFA